MSEPMPLEQARRVMPPIWVIYERPTDYPEHFVVRVFYGLTPEPEAQLATTLIGARAMAIRSGASMRMDRSATDAAHIVESWI